MDKGKERTDKLFILLFKITGLLVIALLADILIMLLYNSVAFFSRIKPMDFFTGSQWNPDSSHSSYSILPLLVSTGLVAFGSMLISIPLGIFTAAFLSEFAGTRLQNILN